MDSSNANALSGGEIAPRQRLSGLDLARGMAILGMFVSHVGPPSWIPDGGVGQTIWIWEVSHSRFPAMFAVVAGVSLALMSGGRIPARGRKLRHVIVRVIVRSALLAVIGVLLAALHTPAIVILVYFALYFIVAIAFLGFSARALFWIAGLWALAGPLASAVLRSTLEPSGRVWTYLLTGDYPVMTWMPFMLVGMAVGRLELRSAKVRRGLLLVGVSLCAIAYGVAALVLNLGGRDQIAGSLPSSSESGESALAQYGNLVHAETGVAPLDTWMWQAVPAPHSGTIMDVVGCIGFCLALIAALLFVGDRSSQATVALWRRVVKWCLDALGAIGQLSLTNYAAHILAMWAVTATTGYDFAPAQPVGVFCIFAAVSLVSSWLWVRWVGRGPLEWVLHSSSTVVANRIVPFESAPTVTKGRSSK